MNLLIFVSFNIGLKVITIFSFRISFGPKSKNQFLTRSVFRLIKWSSSIWDMGEWHKQKSIASERISDRCDMTDRMLGVEPVLQISTQWEAGHLGTYCIAPTKSHHTYREMGWLRITYSIFCSKLTKILFICINVVCEHSLILMYGTVLKIRFELSHLNHTGSFFLWKISKLHWELPSPMLKTIKNNTAPFTY